MKSKLATATLSLALSLAVAACGSPQAEQDGDAEKAMTEGPGVDGTAVTPGQAMFEARTLAAHLTSGEMDRGETAVALEDLDRLVNDNIVEFPEAIRPKLTEDITSARLALKAEDMQGLQEAAVSIENTLSATSTNPQSN